MSRRIILAVSCALSLACSGSDITNPVPPPPSQPFGLFGFVQTGSGVPIPGATMDLFRLPGTMPLYSTETNDSGFFAFPGVQGAFRLQASKLGYTPRTVDPIVRGAMLMRIALAQRFYADTLIAGAWVKSSVPEEAPPCDPEGWDANAPCMRFFFEAPGSGTLKVSITWVGKPELDIVLMSESGAYIGFSDREGVEGAVLKSQVSSGKEYEVRVNSYYGGQAFQIKAELVP